MVFFIFQEKEKKQMANRPIGERYRDKTGLYKEALRREIFEVKGTTNLIVGDTNAIKDCKGFKSNEIFNGIIREAPLGRIKLTEFKITGPNGNNGFITCQAEIYQAQDEKILNVYEDGFYYNGTIRKITFFNTRYNSNEYNITTKYGSENFKIDENASFAHMKIGKKGYGIILYLDFSSHLGYDEIKEKLLRLFPKQ